MSDVEAQVGFTIDQLAKIRRLARDEHRRLRRLAADHERKGWHVTSRELRVVAQPFEQIAEVAVAIQEGCAIALSPDVIEDLAAALVGRPPYLMADDADLLALGGEGTRIGLYVKGSTIVALRAALNRG